MVARQLVSAAVVSFFVVWLFDAFGYVMGKYSTASKCRGERISRHCAWDGGGQEIVRVNCASCVATDETVFLDPARFHRRDVWRQMFLPFH